MEFFHTKQIADELEGLSHAISSVKHQLFEKRLFGIATLVIELFEKHGIESVRVAVTEQQVPPMFPDAAGEDRWLHVSVTVQPGDELLDVPSQLFPAQVLSEGAFEASRSDPIITETLEMWKKNQDVARLQLALHLQTCFQIVLRRDGVNVLTQR